MLGVARPTRRARSPKRSIMFHRCVVVLVFALLAPASAMGQGGKRTTLTIPLAAPDSRSTAWKVAKVSPTGAITLTFERGGDATALNLEGYAFLLPKGEAKALARVLVTDVEPQAILVKTSAEAARLFAEGDDVLLVRSAGDAMQLRAIPEKITLAEGDGEGGKVVNGVRSLADRSQSGKNLGRIGLALHNYTAANGHLPPAVARGPDGRPRHSWRVLILPYLDDGGIALWKQYDVSQPWDSARNLKILDKMPSVYRDPAYPGDKGHFTNYAVIVGEETPFPPAGMTMVEGKGLDFGEKLAGGIGFASIKDGISNTLAVVQVSPGRKIPWTKPEDIEFKLDRRFGKPDGESFPKIGEPGGIAAPYEVNGQKVALVLLMDGSCKILSARLQKPVLAAIITKDGGEVVSKDLLNLAYVGSPRHPTTMTIVIEGGKATATLR